MLRLAATVALAVPLLAQIPGQSPGQYPGQTGRVPGQQTPRLPIPGQNPPRQQPRPSTTTSRQPAKDAAIVTTTQGTLRKVATSQFVMEADDHRIMWFRFGNPMPVTKETKTVDIETLEVGDDLSVDSTADDQGILTAVSVTWQKAGTPAQKAEASRTWDLPRLDSRVAPRRSDQQAKTNPSTQRGEDDRPILRRNEPKQPEPEPKAEPKQSPQPAEPEEVVDNRPATTIRPEDRPNDSDDPGKPVLKRGGPVAARRPASTTAPAEATVAASAPAVVRNEPKPVFEAAAEVDPEIVKAREAAASYSESLPNFFAKQLTTRFQSEKPKSGWQAIDTVSADVAYEDGKESYKNIKIGNKAVNQNMDEIPGARSTGEFFSILDSILSPGNGATFRKGGQESIRNRATLVYHFDIARERSDWRVESPSQLYYPAIRGTIWIDKETHRVLRLEQEGRNMPKLFPFDTVETTADYDFVRLGTTGPFLLPVEAQVLSCQRGTSYCSRNQIEFRNYRKFGSESDITFEDPAK